MSDFNTITEAIEKELITLFKDNGVADVNTGDIYSAAPRYPAIDILLTDREQNDLQTMQHNPIGWNLFYDISCMFAGSEGKQTFKNARKFVDKIYDIIQAEKENNLSDTVHDLECIRVEYGRTTIRTDVMSDGGVIKLIIQIFEQR
ncbi:hypothetical protein KAR91_80515 [Candidatus Pacearchaeota archaeon]|nr:hypothetical protein [Candidatus Pacearchaeota archaeon]